MEFYGDNEVNDESYDSYASDDKMSLNFLVKIWMYMQRSWIQWMKVNRRWRLRLKLSQRAHSSFSL